LARHAARTAPPVVVAPVVAVPAPVASVDTAVQQFAVTMELEQGPHAHQGFDLDRPLREARDGFEKAYFEFHLAREGGSMTRVAEKTGLERTHLYRKLRQLGVDLARGKRN
jgi:DNA-binding NtrC family response regulator